MTVDLLIREARFAVMADEDGTVHEGVSIAIDDGRIVAVGPDLASDARTVIDGRGTLVMPGLVNLHTHLPMALLRGVAEDVDLQGFLERVWAEEARLMDARGVYVGARLGALEALLSGTTTALDMYFHPADAHRAAVEVGLRHVTGPVFFSFAGPDGLAWEERMALARDWPATLAALGGPHVPAALMPHAAFTVGIDHLREIAELARAQGALVHTHASENDRENADTVASTGLRPVAALDASGILALGPVLGHGVRLDDGERYQTIYSRQEGSAAAPTAGLHFTPDLLMALRDKGVRIANCVLHIGLDTFQPVKVDHIEDHHMHSEYAYLSPDDARTINDAKLAGKRVIAVGTTSARTLETAGLLSAGLEPSQAMETPTSCPWRPVTAFERDTNLFIYPGYRWRVVDAIITNFHLPKSTLLMMMSSFAGQTTIREAYETAKREGYRFFSFGDAMFITD